MLRIVIAGAAGRMGKALCRAVLQRPDCILAGALVESDSPFIDQAIGRIQYTPRLQELLPQADVVIDFTTPASSATFAALAAQTKTPLVIGTTGLTAAQEDALQQAGRHTAIVYSPNMSVGVNLFWFVAEQLARGCDDTYALSIAETHHVHKQDAPSGTAKQLQRLVARASGRTTDAIPVHSERHGEVVGDHTLTLQGSGDVITLAHHAKSRDIFVDGALVAARWIAQQPAGYYSMREVLGLRQSA